MKVSELIEFLKTQPQDALIAYEKYSEYCAMGHEEIYVRTLCEPRPDGWVHDYRDDKPKALYVIFPGN